MHITVLYIELLILEPDGVGVGRGTGAGAARIAGDDEKVGERRRLSETNGEDA